MTAPKAQALIDGFPACTTCGAGRFAHAKMALGHRYAWPPEFDGPLQKAIDVDENYAPTGPFIAHVLGSGLRLHRGLAECDCPKYRWDSDTEYVVWVSRADVATALAAARREGLEEARALWGKYWDCSRGHYGFVEEIAAKIEGMK